MDGQPAWRFCDKCWGLFFNGNPDLSIRGRCPAGDAHTAQGFVCYIPHDVPDSVGQLGWRFCDKCFGMFFNGNPPNTSLTGHCPAGGGHDGSNSWPFAIPHNVSEPTGQPDWAFCGKCNGLFFNGDPNQKGSCPGGGAPGHDGTNSWPFAVPHRGFPSPSVKPTAVALDGRGFFIQVAGTGFEPDQTVRVSYKAFFSPTGFQPPGEPIDATTDSEGNLLVEIPTTPDLSSATVSVFDFGSGETAIGTTDN
jgi:hypothetical protein